MISGIIASKTTDILRRLEAEKKIEIRVIGNNTRKKNAYYLNRDSKESIRIYYE